MQRRAEPPQRRTVSLARPSAMLLFSAAATGIVLDRLFSLPVMLGLGGAAIAIAMWAMLHVRTARPTLAGVLLLAGTGALAAAWHHVRWNDFPADDLSQFATLNSRPICLEAVVVSRARVLPTPPRDPLRAIQLKQRSRLLVRAVKIRDGQHWTAASGEVVVLIDGLLDNLRADDRVRILGYLSRIAPPSSPGTFDFAEFGRADRRLCRLRCESPACIELLEAGNHWDYRAWLDGIRAYGSELLARHISEPNAALASALLLGLREQVDDELERDFLETGTIHLLAISGLNVAILAATLFAALRIGWLSRRVALCLVMGLVAFYALVTDSQPPVIRATLMVIGFGSAVLLGRRTSAFHGLALAGLVCLALNPADLFRVGPQLSFLATATLYCGAMLFADRGPHDPLDEFIFRSRPWYDRMARTSLHRTWQGIAIGTIVWAVVLPLVVARFHCCSLVAVALNPLIALPVTVGIISGFVVLAFGAIIPPLAAVAGWICDHCLSLLTWLVHTGPTIPGSHYWLPGPPEWTLLLFYGGLAVWMAVPAVRRQGRWVLPILAATVLIPTAVKCQPHRSDRLTCTFLSVGHGLAVVLELPDGQTVLYDTGQLSSPRQAAETASRYLWSRGRVHLDAVIVSHADVDHFNGIPELFQRFGVREVYTSQPFTRDQGEATAVLRRSIEGKKLDVRILDAGDRLEVGGTVIEVLHPPHEGVAGSDNANSIVLDVQFEGRSVLLTGDLEAAGFTRLFALPPRDCDVVLVPHHGSRKGRPADLAQWCTPEWGVVSDGFHAEPAVELEEAYGQAGCKLLHTAESGTVTVILSRDEVSVSAFRK